MTRRSSTVTRRECFDAHKCAHPVTGRIIMYCGLCDCEIDPVRMVWEADHKVPIASGGADELANIQPLCAHCHKQKTRGDVRGMAKMKRVGEKHYGIKRPKRIMPGSRGHYLKKKLDGSVVRRDSE